MGSIKQINMKQILQEVKDEVAAAKNYKDFDAMLDYNMLHTGTTHKLKKEVLNKYINEAMQLYHTRLLAEAGKGLWKDAEVLEMYADNRNDNNMSDAITLLSQQLKSKASVLLAAKQGEVDKLNQDIAGKVGVIGNFLEEHDKLKSQLKTAQEEVKSQVMINTIAVVDVRRLENELRESKAEVERLKEVIENRNSHIDKLTK